MPPGSSTGKSSTLRSASSVPTASRVPFEVGQVVTVKWKDNQRYLATLVEFHENKKSWTIKWHDDFKLVTVQPESNIRHLKVGDRVVCQYKGAKYPAYVDQYFCATIEKIKEIGKKYDIEWADLTEDSNTDRDANTFYTPLFWTKMAFNKYDLFKHRCADYDKVFGSKDAKDGAKDEKDTDTIALIEVARCAGKLKDHLRTLNHQDEKSGASKVPNRAVFNVAAAAKLYGSCLADYLKSLNGDSVPKDIVADTEFLEVKFVAGDMLKLRRNKPSAGVAKKIAAKKPRGPTPAPGENPFKANSPMHPDNKRPQFEIGDSTESVTDVYSLYWGLPNGSKVMLFKPATDECYSGGKTGLVYKRQMRNELIKDPPGVDFVVYIQGSGERYHFRLPRDAGTYGMQCTGKSDFRQAKLLHAKFVLAQAKNPGEGGRAEEEDEEEAEDGAGEDAEDGAGEDAEDGAGEDAEAEAADGEDAEAADGEDAEDEPEESEERETAASMRQTGRRGKQADAPAPAPVDSGAGLNKAAGGRIKRKAVLTDSSQDTSPAKKKPRQQAAAEKPSKPAAVEEPSKPAAAEKPSKPAAAEKPSKPAAVEEPDQQEEPKQPKKKYIPGRSHKAKGV